LKMRRKYGVIASVCILLLFLVLAAGSGSDSKKDSSTSDSSKAETATKADLDKIKVEFDAQDMVNEKGEQKVVVWVKNTHSEVFDGSVSVTSKDVDGSRLGGDSIFIDKLKPGEKTYAICWFKTSSSPEFTYSISGSFTQAKTGTEVLDQQASKEFTQYMYENFGGCGDPKYQASWYPDIAKSEVYGDSEPFARVTLKTQGLPEDKVTSIGTAAYGWANSDGKGITYIEVVGPDGAVLKTVSL